MNSGTLLVSLDFELFWGMQDVHPLDDYHSNISGAKSVVDTMLGLFDDYSIHATWATVGFLFANNVEQLKGFLPSDEQRPTYKNAICNSYRCFEWIGKDANLGKYFFASELIDRIIRAEHQEIATHTFSHYYCKEAGQTTDQFKADMEAAKRIASELKGVDVKTLVFPRNQSESKYVDILSELGMVAYRGEEDDWIHSKMGSSRLMRIFRLLDSYIPLTGSGCYMPHKTPQGVVNLKGSRFLRPYNKKLAVFEKLKLWRIKKQMLHAAQKGLVFHLWWHPHNFGVKQEYHLAFLKKILEYYHVLSKKYGMRSLNILEAARKFNESR